MSKQNLTEAGDAFRQGNLAEVVELVDNSLIDAADSPEAADRLRFVRAFALVQTGKPQAALIVLDAMDPGRRTARPALQLATAACLAANDLDRARTALAQLVKSGDRAAIATYQIVLVQRGLDAVAARDFPVALETLRAAQIQYLQDTATRFAAWLGLLGAGEGTGDRAAVAQSFALFPDWAQDRRANLICARSAIAGLDVANAIKHLDALGAHADAWPLWWWLCKRLLAAARYKDVVELFGNRRPGMPEDHLRAVAVVVAIALHAMHRRADAQQTIEQLVVRSPGDPFLAHVAAFLAYAAGGLQRAEKHLRRVTDDSAPVMLLRWALLFGRERYEPIRDALTPEAVRAWPEGAERDTASMMASLANLLLGSPSRAWALLRVAGDPERSTASSSSRYLHGYLALADHQHAQAARLLGGSPLGALACIESARDLADAGSYLQALAELKSATGRGLDPAVIDTRNLIRLQQAQDAMRVDDMLAAGGLLAQVRAEAPHLIGRVVGLEDYAAVRATLKSVKSADPARIAEMLWELHGTAPPDASEHQQTVRRRDLAYLTGVMRLRSLAQRTAQRDLVAMIIDALEASLDEEPTFAPAAATLGMILQHRGDQRRALELLDIASQGGLSTPAIRAALAVEYVHHGRLVEAKRIFFDQLAGERDRPAATIQLREIFAQEIATLLRAASRVTPEAPGAMPRTALEPPGLPVSVDPFAGIDARQRIFVLIHHVEVCALGAPADTRVKLTEIARELKRLSVQSSPAGFGELEHRALTLLNGASA